MNILQTLCCKMVERADALNLKGKKGDDDAIAFLAGAATALIETGNVKDGEFVGGYVAMVISVRGLFEVRMIAHRAKEAERDAQILARVEG